jgi:hypothetical protein
LFWLGICAPKAGAEPGTTIWLIFSPLSRLSTCFSHTRNSTFPFGPSRGLRMGPELRQILQIGKVFQPAGGFLVGFQMEQVNDVSGHAVERIHDASGIAFVKLHA